MRPDPSASVARLVRPDPALRVSRPVLTCLRIQVSPQITAITIRRPTIVRTMLAPPELVCEAVEGERLSGVPSPPLLELGVKACAGQA